jgi:ribosomal protein S18 acetylase RimI-like enzyme
MITVRILDIEDITKLVEIDRSEHLTVEYIQDGEKLIEKEIDWDVPPWSTEGTGGHSVNRLIYDIKPHLGRGAVLLGALDGDRLAGIAVLRKKLTGTMAQLMFLHVSRNYRRRGVGTLLTEEMIRLAREDGASEMYVSSTPSGSAVGFYLSHGFHPTASPIRELLELEPDDIHMIRKL